MLLELKDVYVHYHKVAALKGVDMGVPNDGIVTIIGANGAGKSTALRAVSGLVRISRGEIRFRGERIDRLPPEKIVALGIAHVPEGRRVFPGLTVEENLRTGAFLRSDSAGIEKDLHQVYEQDLKQFALIQMNMGREVTRRLREADNRLFAWMGPEADMRIFPGRLS